MIENYSEIGELLSAGEMEGRRWVFDRGRDAANIGKTPTDHDVLELHRVMFGHFLEWAGATRREDRGPAGIVSVPWPDVRPFRDTNGRTGRALDHYLLWVTFGLRADSLETSPAIEYFPSDAHEDEYYEGLQEADLGRPERIRAFYLERLLALFAEA